MPVHGKFELNITTGTQEEMDKIADAIFSGYAENLLQERILWSQYAAPSAPMSPAQSQPLPELQRVATKAKGEVKTVKIEQPERKVGILGRGRLGRS